MKNDGKNVERAQSGTSAVQLFILMYYGVFFHLCRRNIDVILFVNPQGEQQVKGLS